MLSLLGATMGCIVGIVLSNIVDASVASIFVFLGLLMLFCFVLFVCIVYVIYISHVIFGVLCCNPFLYPGCLCSFNIHIFMYILYCSFYLNLHLYCYCICFIYRTLSMAFCILFLSHIVGAQSSSI